MESALETLTARKNMHQIFQGCSLGLGRAICQNFIYFKISCFGALAWFYPSLCIAGAFSVSSLPSFSSVLDFSVVSIKALDDVWKTAGMVIRTYLADEMHPTDRFTIMKPQNMSTLVSQLHKMIGSTDFEPLNMWIELYGETLDQLRFFPLSLSIDLTVEGLSTSWVLN